MTKKAHISASSENMLMRSIFKLADAGGSIIQVRTRETMRTAVALRRAILSEPNTCYREWDIVNGFRTFTLENFTDHRAPGGPSIDFVAAFEQPLVDLRTPSSAVMSRPTSIHYVVYINPQPFIENNPYVQELLQQYAAILPTGNVCLILVTDDRPLPVPQGLLLTTEMRTPTHEELRGTLDATLRSGAEPTFSAPVEISDEERDMICALGAGMSRYEFETHAAIAIVEAALRGEDTITAKDLMDGISQGKTEVVKQSDILELFQTEDMSEVGGMQRLKDWIAARKDAFSEEAEEFGIEPPKGIFIAGVPGTGKSLVAKAIASTMGVPLLRLDFGRVFSKYIGDSESRMRQALKMVEEMGRLVLFADEIDKGLGGIGSGGGDSGTSSRVLGAFLTWMQETSARVFVVMTANRVDGLPPELTRKGRMDQIFSTGLPNVPERREVLAVHLKKRKRNIEDFSESEIQSFIEKSEGFVPAEIEQAVKDALIMAFNDKEADDLEMRHLLDALGVIIPMSKSHKAQIDRILDWAQQNAISVSYSDEEMRKKLPATNARVVRARRSLH